MTRIAAIEPEAATGRARELLAGVQRALGVTPNMMRTMAHSPAVLEGYLAFNKSLSQGVLEPGFREQVAITVAEANACNYCLSAHTALGKAAGVSSEELEVARSGSARDPKAEAGLRFAQEIVRRHGQIGAGVLSAVRSAGYTEAEVTELIAHVALNIFTNYFNWIAGTEVDFPSVAAARAV